MILLSLNNITKAYGTDVILKDINFSINENEKIGLVGRNGAGKTTIFKMISQQMLPDSGSIFISKDKKVGYLSQNLNLDENITVFEETLKVFEDLIAIEKRLRELEELISHHSINSESNYNEILLKEYGNLQEEFERNNGYGIESFARSILVGLGISNDDFTKKIMYLSGGQKTRVALAKLLLENPDILLLDEPTNHLDLSAIYFLENFLKEYRGTIIIISHDRYFLDIITNRTYELTDGHIEEYNGNYSYFINERQNRYEQRIKDYELQQQEIKRLEEIIERYRSFNREKSIKQAESREKALDKIERIDRPTSRDKSARILFDIRIRSGNDVLLIDNISKSYNQNVLFENLSMLIRREERIALIGENGKGKTTIFKIICDIVKPDKGYVKLGKNVKIGYYDQEQKNISNNKIVLDEIWDEYPELTVTEVRNYLAAFLFTGDDVFKNIDTLSGGEKSRLSLLKLMISNSNFLLLDEPTNHLDIMAREALEKAMLEYPGTLLTISHDRYFLNKVIKKIVELVDGNLIEYLGNFEYYQNKKNSPKDEIVINTVGKTRTEVKDERKKIREAQGNKLQLQKSLKEVEREIEEMEKLIKNYEEQLCREEVYSNPLKSIEVSNYVLDSKKVLDDLYTKWEELSISV
jgi:ATP-binding cassette, subfamily F, member 3